MQSYKYSKSVKNAFVNNKLLSVLESIMGKRVIPFHTINFFKGSEQDAHSDAFHMSTFPEGNLIAVWVALEDIREDQGPVLLSRHTFVVADKEWHASIRGEFLEIRRKCK